MNTVVFSKSGRIFLHFPTHSTTVQVDFYMPEK